MLGARRDWFTAIGAVALLASVACSAPPSVTILSPAHGAFTTAASVSIDGIVIGIAIADAAVTLNGSPVTLAMNGTFSEIVTLDPALIYNPVEVKVTDTSNGFTAMDRIVVIAGDSVADGDFSNQSIALRINDTGLEEIEPIVTALVDLDPSTLVMVGQVVLDECVVFDPFFGFCLGSATVTVVNPPPTISGFGIDMDSMVNFVAADVLVTDLAVNLDIDGSGLVPNCGLTITADTTDIIGDYGLSPDPAGDIDVDQLGGVAIVFGNFQDNLSGICDVPIIGDIIQLFLPDIEDAVTTGFQNLLDDPDGPGPMDAVIADAIEVALAEVQISGPIGESLGVMLETPLFDVPEDNDGITLGSNTRITADFGTGPGQCDPPPGAPDLAASLHVAEPFPTLGATTPSGAPYELGLCISTSAFNQLLKGEIECGLLQQQLTEFDLGFGPVPLTTGVLSLIIPEFVIFPGASPVLLAIRPTLAPVLTGNPGPAGEIAELRMGHLVMDILDATPGVAQPLLSVAIEFRAGLDLAFDDATGQLAPTISAVDPADITVGILDNLIRTDEATLQLALPTLIASVLPQLGDSLGAFPLPAFLGLALQGVEVASQGEFMSLYLDLVVPTVIPSSDGSGADAYVSSAAPLLNTGSDAEVLVETDGVVDNAVGYLKFDLAAVSFTAASASLALDLTTLSGGAAATFSVYGLLDAHGGEGWSEAAIDYSSAPAILPVPAPLVDVAQVFGGAALGSFSVATPNLGATVSFTSAELRDFVNDDTNGVITLILTRDGDDATLASGFASKEHGSAIAPTLTVVPMNP